MLRPSRTTHWSSAIRIRIVPQGADGLPRVSESRYGQLSRPLDRGAQSVAGRFPAGQLACPLKLDGQAGQRVREHVVQLACNAASLGHGGCGGLALTSVLELGQ
jgi:hypothetical protein